MISLPPSEKQPEARVAIITFDATVHFYNLAASLSQAQMLVVPDIDDVFVPLSTGCLVGSPSPPLPSWLHLTKTCHTTGQRPRVCCGDRGPARQAAEHVWEHASVRLVP